MNICVALWQRATNPRSPFSRCLPSLNPWVDSPFPYQHMTGMFLKSNYLKVIRLHQTTICVLSKGLLQRSQLSSKSSVGVPLLTISLSHGVIFCICLVQQGCHTYSKDIWVSGFLSWHICKFIGRTRYLVVWYYC